VGGGGGAGSWGFTTEPPGWACADVGHDAPSAVHAASSALATPLPRWFRLPPGLRNAEIMSSWAQEPNTLDPPAAMVEAHRRPAVFRNVAAHVRSVRLTHPHAFASSALAAGLRRVDPLLFVVWTALHTLLSARAFYGYMLKQTGGEWSAPLDDVFIHLDYARATALGHPFEWTIGNELDIIQARNLKSV